jgi:hypothetical protein
MLGGWHGGIAGRLGISSKPRIETCLKSKSTAVIWNWFTCGQVKPVTDDLNMTCSIVFLSCWAATNAVAKHATECAALGVTIRTKAFYFPFS